VLQRPIDARLLGGEGAANPRIGGRALRPRMRLRRASLRDHAFRPDDPLADGRSSRFGAVSLWLGSVKMRLTDVSFGSDGAPRGRFSEIDEQS
jgi:hypothetical protein